MKRIAIFYPNTDSEVPVYYTHLTKVLSDFASKYAITPETLSVLQAHAVQVVDAYQQAKADMEKAQSSTQRKNIAFSEARENLLRELQRITHLPNFEEADAELIGIRRTKQKIDPNHASPKITKVTMQPDQIILSWIKSNFQGVMIEGSYDSSTWTEITRIAHSPYRDTRRNQVANSLELRYYRFRYLMNDKPIGLYSPVIKVVSEID